MNDQGGPGVRNLEKDDAYRRATINKRPRHALETQALGERAVTVPAGDNIVVRKAERRMELRKGDKTLKIYKIALGANPIGHKMRQGDEKTPEGLYYLDYRNEKSRFYKAFHISYPNKEDTERAHKLGLNPGGDIMIHGTSGVATIWHRFSDTWTDGCIAVTNAEIDELWIALPRGTPIPIHIYP